MEYISVLLSFVLLIVFLYYAIKIIIERIRFVQIIDCIPGPPGYPLIGDALDFLKPRNELMKCFIERNAKYGPMFRAWAGPLAEIHLLRPEQAEVIMSNTKNINKSLAYKFLEPWLGTGLLTSNGEKWHKRRKLITPTFHFKILDDFLGVFGEKAKVLVNLLEKKADGKEFDMYPFITRCALDIICETAMGTHINAQNETDSTYVTAVYDISELSFYRGMRPWLYPNFIWKLTETGKKFSKQIKVLHDFTNKVIAERKESWQTDYKKAKSNPDSNELFGEKKRMAFLDLLLEAPEQGHELSQSDIREEVDTFMFEGHDTTTAGMAWAIFLLGNHPEIQEKVVEELDLIFGDSDRLPTMRDLNEMKYLEMVIKETLRLYPSVPFIGRDVTEEVYIDGYQIPVGSVIAIQIYQIHRCADQFPNPEKFDPDNFLPERAQGRHPYAYIPFSAGPRNCIGQKFALLEEKTVLSLIFRRFKIVAIENQENITLLSELVLRPESGIRVKMYPR